MKNFFHSTFACLSLTLMALPSFSQSSVFVSESNVALQGYDVVSYHNAHSAIRGSADFTVKQDGATYYFSSLANKEAFKKNSSAFLPAYGGYCAFAMAMKGAKVPSDPKTFKIYNGKLYLFFNDYYEGNPFNTIIPWNSGEKEMLTKANANWKNM